MDLNGFWTNGLWREAGMRVFRADVEPKWEDAANTGHGAGKWTSVMPDEAAAKAAYRVVLGEMMGEGVPGVNGAILAYKRGKFLLVLWTASHEAENMAEDVFRVRGLMALVSEMLGVPLRLKFSPHAASSLGNAVVEKIQSEMVKGARFSGGLKAAFGKMSRTRTVSLSQPLGNLTNMTWAQSCAA